MRSLLILILSFFSYQTIEDNKKESYFEGVITYSVETNIKIKDKYSDYVSQKYGTQMDFFWNQNGDLLRQTTGNKSGLEYALHKHDENISYMKFKTLDTLYYYPSSESFDEIIEIKEGTSDVILDHECKSLTFLIRSPSQQDTIKMYYYYSGKPFINKELYKNLKDGFANIIYEKTESPFMRMTLDFKTYSITYEAIKIVEREINDERFKVEDGMVKKRV